MRASKKEHLDVTSSPWGATDIQKQDCEHAIVSPAEFNAAGSALLSRNSAKASSLTRATSLDGNSEAYRKGTSSPGLGRTGSQGSGGMEEPFQTTVYEQAFTYKGTKVRAKSTPNILSWKPVSGSSVFCDRASKCRKIPYDEILSAWQMPSARSCQIGLCPSEYALVIYAVGRKPGQPSKWHLEEHHLIASSLEQVKDWAAIINGSLQKCHHRPKNLLVLINPFSGAKRSRIVWEQKARPVFEKAHIKYALVETLQADHAREMISRMKPDELLQYQGIVAVGGDGVFQECVMGLMEQRALGGANLAAATRVRVGHIPGGSTDAVACSLHATRCAETAALHVALGDRLALDVATIACQPSAQELRARSHSASAVDVVSHPIVPGPTPMSGMAPPSGLGGSGPDGTEELLSHSNGTSCTGYTGTSEAEDALMMAGEADRGASHKLTSSSTEPTGAGAHKSGLNPQSGLPQGFAHSATKAGGAAEGAGPGSGLANRLRCRNFVCQAAYGYFGDVMRASEGLRFMGPSRYDFSGFLQLVKLQSYRLQIMYKPASQPLRADAQDVCSHKCEVCRLAGLSLLEQSQGASELTTPLSSPSKAPPSGNNPRPPLPPSLHIPASPSLPRGQSHPSPSPGRRNSSGTLVNNPSYQRENSQRESSSPTKHASDSRLHPLLPPLHPGSPSRSPSSNLAESHAAATSGRRTDAAAAATGRISGSGTGAQGGGEQGGVQSHHARGAGAGRAGADSPGRVSPSEGSASALLGSGGEDGPCSVARQLLEQSGVSPGDARTGCSAAGMTRQQQGWNSGPLESGWVSTEGEYVSVMVVATPCRSDMTKRGIVPNAHLSDGRLYLILVSSCNRLDYLRFLIRLSSKGLEDECFPFVKIVPVTGVVINPLPPGPTSPLYANTLAKCCPPPESLHICPGESAWNVDGELLPHNAVRIGITRGAVDVFARGVELKPPSL